MTGVSFKKARQEQRLSENPADSSKQRFSFFLTAVGVLVTALGILVVASWHAHYTAILQINSHFPPMQYNSAVCFILCGLALLFTVFKKSKLTTFVTVMLLIIGLLTLAEYLSGIDLKIDQLLMRHYITLKTSNPGRMSPNTAIGFILIAAAFLMGQNHYLKQRRLIQGVLGAWVVTLGAIALFGYLSGIKTTYAWGGYTQTSVHTSVAFLIIGFALIVLSSHRENKYLPLVISVCVGLTVSIQIFYSVSDAQERSFRAKFNLKAQERISAFQRELESDLNTLKGLSAFYNSSPTVDADEFHKFTKTLLFEHSSAQALEWIPRVRYWERQAYEEKMRAQGFADYSFKEFNTNNKLMEAQTQRDEHFPVYFLEPYEPNKNAFGFDLASNPAYLAVLKRARDIGRAVAAVPLDPVSSRDSGKYGIFVADAIYHKGAWSDSLEWRRENLTGFVAGLFRMDDILGRALQYIDPTGLDMYVYDLSAPAGRRFILRHHAGSHQQEHPSDERFLSEKEINEMTGLFYTEILDIEGRQWMTFCVPANEYIAQKKSWVSWTILILGFCFTFLFAAYLYHVVRSRERLLVLNDQLAKEVQERKRMEEMQKNRSRVLESLAVGGGLQDVLDLIVETLEAVDPEMMGLILLFDRTENRLRYGAARNLPDFYIHEIDGLEVVADNKTPCGQAAYLGQRVVVEDVCKNSNWKDYKTLAVRAEIGASLSEPFFSSAGKLLGVLAMYYREPQKLSDDNSSLIRTAAHLASIAVEHYEARIALQNAHDELERRVIERTAKLAEANTNLIEEITDRKLAEEKLRQVSFAMENALSGIARCDAEDHYTSANKVYAELIGYEPSELLGKSWKGIVMSADRDKMQPALDHMHKTGKGEIEVRVLCKDESIFHAHIVMIKIENKASGFSGYYMFLKDVTEHKYKESLEIKSEMISMVAHELRTPLHAVREGVSVMLEGLAGEISEDQKEVLESTKSSLDRLVRLVNSFLDFQKLEAGIVEMKMEKNDINQEILGVQKMLEPFLHSKGLKLNLNLSGDLPQIEYDHDRIVQVLMNLLHNAIKFTEKGNITVESSRDGDFVRISVKDTGIGIKKEDAEKLFRKFAQLESGKRIAPGGTGLGLVISKRIIEEHNGQLWVESQYRKGSVFLFQLPISVLSGKDS